VYGVAGSLRSPIHVGFQSRSLIIQHLWGGPRRRPANVRIQVKGLTTVVLPDVDALPEISNLRNPLAGEKDVQGLQVSVGLVPPRVGMQVFHSPCNLLDYVEWGENIFLCAVAEIVIGVDVVVVVVFGVVRGY
tara:strand:+ start:299 stop:697 length:399 start_codon:yes stop_codon:yes gene_type:complete